MGLVLKDSEKVDLAIQGLDAAGNPAPLEGVEWAVSDSLLLDLVVAEGGLLATVSAVGPLGKAQVSVKADALIGEGIAELIGTLDVEIVAGQAVAIAISAGVPAPK